MINERYSFRATGDQADRRLDRVLRGLFRDVPLGAVMKSIRNGSVRVNGRKASGDFRLSAGDEVAVPWTRDARGIISDNNDEENAGGDLTLSTLFRNEFLWCVDKPPGLLAQPDEPGGDSVITRAWHMLGWKRDDFRPAVTGRLDRNVSGVTAIALTYPALRAISEHMRNGAVKKIYRAVVYGKIPETGRIDIPLVKDGRRNIVCAARPGDSGMDSLTLFRRIRFKSPYSLAEIELVTGRPHQARAHLALLGFPIAGDEKYGFERHARSFPRPMLHAYSLSFPDDSSLPGIEGLTIKSPMPGQFISFFV
ncbi:MAG: RluA family pseudouridine synthase [Synergistaceae bacterium]|jgi:23S rRNA pseudouridine955/2504/2580 synthase|nr:RluA family pseudouridine synthase [Synergistaceae bacterium]